MTQSSLVLMLLSMAASALLTSPVAAQTTTRVSVSSAGAEGNGHSASQSISVDGRFVAFASWARNLVSGDTNGYADIFIHDRQTAQTIRASVNSVGTQGNNDSYQQPSISTDGRVVAFPSLADNLVPGDTNGAADIFVHDLQTTQTSRVSVDSAGVQGNNYSYESSISADGRFATFDSSADNLVSGDTNGTVDIFIHNRHTGMTSRVSVDSSGVQGCDESRRPKISADGRVVAFQSYANNLVSGDTNGVPDIFVHDLQTGETSRVSVDSAGAQGNFNSWWPSISADGRFIAFDSSADNLVSGDTNQDVDIFVHDRQTGQSSRVSVDSAGVQGNSDSYEPSISADGRFVAFHSHAGNLVPGDTNGAADIFIHDRQTGQTSRVSVDSVGVQGNGSSAYPSISADGRFAAFWSGSTNLVSGDTNGAEDVFVHDRGPWGVILSKLGSCLGNISLTITGASPNGLLAVIYGPAGTLTKPSPPCAGMTLGVASPTIGALIRADGAGQASLNLRAPASACGISVQIVDLMRCVPSNTIVL